MSNNNTKPCFIVSQKPYVNLLQCFASGHRAANEVTFFKRTIGIHRGLSHTKELMQDCSTTVQPFFLSAGLGLEINKTIQRVPRQRHTAFSCIKIETRSRCVSSLHSVTLVDTPGIIETSEIHSRSYNYIEVLPFYFVLTAVCPVQVHVEACRRCNRGNR